MCQIGYLKKEMYANFPLINTVEYAWFDKKIIAW